MPTYFRFLSLLPFKIFAGEQVDVVILEVGLGGKFDATNVVQSPVVCGISSLGYDHMEILGNTLGEIAGEKAGIFKKGVPAFTVLQPDEAMHVLEETASELDVPLKAATVLDRNFLNGLHLGLQGDHQYLNAGLAIALCSIWLQTAGHLEFNYLEQTFIEGLTTATLQGRAQVVPDQFIDIERQGDLVFYLDGAHSPESMEVCAKWFSLSIKKDGEYQKSLKSEALDNSRASGEHVNVCHNRASIKNSTQILLFNCMSVRDPQLLLLRLMNTCTSHGVHFKKVLFVPSLSVYNKVGTSNLPPTFSQVDVSWQLTLQRLYEYIIHGAKGDSKSAEFTSHESKDDTERRVRRCENSTVFPSLPLAIKWLRDNA